MKLSQWHHGGVTPVHIGIYERVLRNGGTNYSWWNGSNWMCGAKTIAAAIQLAHNYPALVSYMQTVSWRGVVR